MVNKISNSQPGNTKRTKRWWQTDCEACRRGRLILLWALLMIPLALWWLT